MKSELYQTIYKMATFCIVAAAGLTIGGILLCHHIFCVSDSSLSKKILCVIVAVFGVILLIAGIVIRLHFQKKYKEVRQVEQQVQQEQQREQQEQQREQQQ